MNSRDKSFDSKYKNTVHLLRAFLVHTLSSTLATLRRGIQDFMKMAHSVASPHGKLMFQKSVQLYLLRPQALDILLDIGNTWFGRNWTPVYNNIRHMSDQEKFSQFNRMIVSAVPELFNIVEGEAVWRIPCLPPSAPSTSDRRGLTEATAILMCEMEGRWRIVAAGKHRYQGNVIVRGRLSKAETSQIRQGQLPNTLRKYGILASVIRAAATPGPSNRGPENRSSQMPPRATTSRRGGYGGDSMGGRPRQAGPPPQRPQPAPPRRVPFEPRVPQRPAGRGPPPRAPPPQRPTPGAQGAEWERRQAGASAAGPATGYAETIYSEDEEPPEVDPVEKEKLEALKAGNGYKEQKGDGGA